MTVQLHCSDQFFCVFPTVRMKLELLLVVSLVHTFVISQCQALYWDYRPQVTVNAGLASVSTVGDYADYGDKRIHISSTALVLIADDNFGCEDYLSPNATAAILSATDPFVMMIPLDFERCRDYRKAYVAAHAGASGILFYYFSSDSGNTKLSKPSKSGPPILSIPIAAIEISERTLVSIQEQLEDPNNNGIVSIIGKYYQSIHTSQTFYFVVFSFCILTLLSCLWFMLSYIRKCRTRAQRRQRRVQAERETRQLVDNLPVKTHKSKQGVEEPTCAICLETFHNKDTIRVLPCHHEFHKRCIDPWLKLKRTCPMCKEDIGTKHSSSDSDNTSRDTDSVSTDTSSARLLSRSTSDLSLQSVSSGEHTPQVVVESHAQQDNGHSVVMFEEGEGDGNQQEVAIHLEEVATLPTE